MKAISAASVKAQQFSEDARCRRKKLKGHQRGLGLAPAFQWINFLNSWKEVLSSLGLLSEDEFRDDIPLGISFAR